MLSLQYGYAGWPTFLLFLEPLSFRPSTPCPQLPLALPMPGLFLFPGSAGDWNPGPLGIPDRCYQNYAPASNDAIPLWLLPLATVCCWHPGRLLQHSLCTRGMLGPHFALSSGLSLRGSTHPHSASLSSWSTLQSHPQWFLGEHCSQVLLLKPSPCRSEVPLRAHPLCVSLQMLGHLFSVTHQTGVPDCLIHWDALMLTHT